jgi:protein-disulfide isomerase
MIESSAFQDLAAKFNVSSVPKIVINNTIELIGAEPIEKFLEEIGKI